MTDRLPYATAADNVKQLIGAGVPRDEIATWLGNNGWKADDFRNISQASVPGWLQSIGQGLTFGLSDEATAGVRGAYDKLVKGEDFGPAYDRHLAQERAELARFQGEHPVGSTALEIGGAIAPTLLTGGMAAGPTLGATVARGAALGAGMGGAYGFGTGEGGAENRLGNAATGAAVGGVLGGVAPLATAAVKGGARAVGDLVAPLTRGGTPEDAAGKIAQALGRDQSDPMALAQAYRDAVASKGADVTLTDVAGKNVTGLAEDVMNSPNAQKNVASRMLDLRQQSQLGRVSNDLSSLAGTPANARQVAEDVLAQRKAAAAPAYDKAFQFDPMSMPASDYTQILDLMQTPDGQKAWKSAQRLAGNEGIKLPDMFGPKDGMQALDWWKQGLDQLIGENQKPQLFTGQAADTPLSRSVAGIKRKFLGIIDQANPDYKAARDTFAGPTSYLNAMETGRKALTMRPEDIAAELSNLNASEQEGFRVGAVGQIISKLGDIRGKNPDVTNYFNTPNMKARVGMLIEDPADRAEFFKRLGVEQAMSATNQLDKNSRTAARLAEAENMEDGASLSDALRLVGRSTRGWIGALVNKAVSPLMDKALAARRAEIGRLLLSPDVAQNAQTLRMLSNPPARPPLTSGYQLGAMPLVAATSSSGVPQR